MSLRGPTAVSAVQAIGDKAIDLASDLARIELTKFRFRMGCGLIASAVVVFLLGHMTIAAKYFVPAFTERSWTVTMLLFWGGAAFAGPEVVQAIVNGLKAMSAKN